MAPGQKLTVEQGIRAQTIDAAWQLFTDDVIGALEIGNYADMVVLSSNPRTVDPEAIADLEVRATYLAGHRIHCG
jgi:predicted amidohydrolase YtcJ